MIVLCGGSSFINSFCFASVTLVVRWCGRLSLPLPSRRQSQFERVVFRVRPPARVAPSPRVPVWGELEVGARAFATAYLLYLIRFVAEELHCTFFRDNMAHLVTACPSSGGCVPKCCAIGSSCDSVRSTIAASSPSMQ